jgi:DNA topoisomerase-1
MMMSGVWACSILELFLQRSWKADCNVVVVKALAETPQDAAKTAGLRHVSDRMPGIRRIGTGKTFRYIGPDNRVIRDAETITRIRALAIPPAWKNVWVCPTPQGHLQAVGRDARNRKQYRYHPRWREVRDSTKFERMLVFGNLLPKIRARVAKDLALPNLPREKVLATIVRLLETTLIRVGNEEYAKQNQSYGLTTLRNRHVDVTGKEVTFYFRGKSGIKHVISVEDAHLARVVGRLRDLPGYELFQYVDGEGQVRSIGSTDVNDYLREISGEDFTAKDFRTWAGTVLAAQALAEAPPFTSQTQAKKNVVKAIESVAERLRNTVAVCRKCYIHPIVIESYLNGSLHNFRRPRAMAKNEAALIKILQRWARKNPPSLESALKRSIKASRKK